jgi:uncharacterized cupredoxin-like copper-binding protein
MTRVRGLTLVIGVVTAASVISACGDSSRSSSTAAIDDNSTTADATVVEVTMEDIAFVPAVITVQAGDMLEMRFTNAGKVAHDAFVGDEAAQMDHEAEMTEMTAMTSDDHDVDEPAIVVQPGDSGELSYTFSEPGSYEVGCHQPGHYAAGMKIDVTVE